jgi:hypothetical protein
LEGDDREGGLDALVGLMEVVLIGGSLGGTAIRGVVVEGGFWGVGGLVGVVGVRIKSDVVELLEVAFIE